MKIAAGSKTLDLASGRSGVIAQSTMAGAIITVPAASANHHVTQVAKDHAPVESSKPKLLARTSPAMAMAELMIAVGAKQMTANFAMPRPAVNVLYPYDQRLISHAPANAASAVPRPMAPDSTSAVGVSAPEEIA